MRILFNYSLLQGDALCRVRQAASGKPSRSTGHV